MQVIANQVLINPAFRAIRMLAEHILKKMAPTTLQGWQVLPTWWFKPDWQNQ
jgi:hypothetical protein